MIPSWSLLAISATQASKYFILGCGVILLAAFFLGFIKGFRLIGWQGIVSLGAFELFCYLDSNLKERNLSLSIPANEYITGDALTSVLLALGCVLLMLVLFGLSSKLFRPYYKWIIRTPIQTNPYVEYDEKPNRELVWKNIGPPTIFGRFVGACVCMANIFSILLFLVCAAMIVVGNTSLANSSFVAMLLMDSKMEIIFEYACTSGLDYILICLLVIIACVGFKKGLVVSIYNFISTFGGTLAGILALYLPFSPFKTNKIIQGLITFGEGLIKKIPKVNDMLAGFANVTTTVGQIIAGIILLIAFFAILYVIRFGAGKLANSIRRSKTFSTLDGLIATGLYLLIGVAVCAIICIAFNVLQHYNVMNCNFLADGTFVKILYDLMDQFVKPILSTL